MELSEYFEVMNRLKEDMEDPALFQKVVNALFPNGNITVVVDQKTGKRAIIGMTPNQVAQLLEYGEA